MIRLPGLHLSRSREAAHIAGLRQSVAQDVLEGFVDAMSVLGAAYRYEGDDDDAESTLRGY